MGKKTVLQEVKDRMQEMQDTKGAELQAIFEKKEAAETQKKEAEAALKDATERMDLDAYEDAKQAKRKAQTAIDMYSGRYNQIKQQEYISEEESDKVIDSLLSYENEIAANFKQAIAEPLRALDNLLQTYRAEVEDTEATIKAWGTFIHANYNTRGKTLRTDPLTGIQTDRSDRPVPVHTMPYTGCSEAEQLKTYLEKAEGLY